MICTVFHEKNTCNVGIEVEKLQRNGRPFSRQSLNSPQSGFSGFRVGLRPQVRYLSPHHISTCRMLIIHSQLKPMDPWAKSFLFLRPSPPEIGALPSFKRVGFTTEIKNNSTGQVNPRSTAHQKNAISQLTGMGKDANCFGIYAQKKMTARLSLSFSERTGETRRENGKRKKDGKPENTRLNGCEL